MTDQHSRIACGEDTDLDLEYCYDCSEEINENYDLYDSPYDRLSDAEQYETDQREAFNDRYEAWRNEF